MMDFKNTEYLIYNCANRQAYLISAVLNVDTTSWEVVGTYNGNVEKAYSNVILQHNRKWGNSTKWYHKNTKWIKETE